MKYVIAILLAACGSSTSAPPAAPAPPAQPAEHGHEHAHQHHGAQPLGHRFGKAEKWVPIFDDPARDKWQKPEAVIAALSIEAGMSVADVGAGTGYFTSHLARAVGTSGTVLAVDIEPDMIRYLGERATNERTPQVKPQLATPDDPTLPAASLDRILVVDTWHHIPDRVAYATKLAAALKPGGFVLVVDYTMQTSKGPPRSHRLEPAKVAEELTAAGLRASTVEAGLPDQYVIKAAK